MATPSNFKCPCCNKSRFKTAKALGDHQKALDHYPVACPTCHKRFCDKQAVQQHEQVHLRTTSKKTGAPTSIQGDTPVKQPTTTTSSPKQSKQQPSSSSPPNAPTTKPPPPTIPKTKHTPETLHPLEQDLLVKYLLSRCHPVTRLQAQNYPVPSSTPPDYHSTSEANPAHPRRRAVVLTIETNAHKEPGAESLTHLTATDFLTNEALLHLVVGSEGVEKEGVAGGNSNMTCGSTNTSNIPWVGTRTSVDDYRAARDSLWEVIDADTVLVGHGLHRGLHALRMVHGRVVDAGILTAEAVGMGRSTVPLRRVWGVEELCVEVLGWDWEMWRGEAGKEEPQGKKAERREMGTCAGWEGCVGVRELVVFCLRNPERLRSWAERKAEQDIPGGENADTLGEMGKDDSTESKNDTEKEKRKKNKKDKKDKKDKKNKKHKNKKNKKNKTKKSKVEKQEAQPITLPNASPPQEQETSPMQAETAPELHEQDEEDEDSDEGLVIVQWQDLE
ncbi:uncharacterized protein BO97DRAFT_128838 [Aspergillus homomorphus CBS 101889]|uniref:C2H2-type domain-containing protein n=1 Tax=Aspergillus homomorphus (strain CBS 101889) TaxID=1450537 RepID=A0A395I821_ASPHC|nr:hypothetical protein BO97DRAFT_128838 [Aspergillus homomorphus CBS 101889]RAL16241.1 hypothetical protein BO97DRAFT_128838 [Aspergillus homomorphus CBS 101889]